VPILHAIVLGIVQGLSEFLPISSSGHLILVPELFDWTELTRRPSLNKTFDVALHVGTFVGAAWYFRNDLARYVAAAWRSLRHRAIRSVDERMAWLLLVSAIPGAIVGATLEGVIEDHLGQPVLIGVMLIVFGVVLLLADRLPEGRHQDDFRLRDALLMGTAQAVALQPGVSRSGITISMGRWLAFDRGAAARLSFLMSLPIIAGAGLFKGLEVVRDGGIPDNYVAPFLWGMLAAAISAFIVIALLLKFLQTHTFTPFVIYRIAAGAAVILVFASGLR
jgi:undecaprenyl-diphosphatase